LPRANSSTGAPAPAPAPAVVAEEPMEQLIEELDD
jgi:hypothetical protein